MDPGILVGGVKLLGGEGDWGSSPRKFLDVGRSQMNSEAF